MTEENVFLIMHQVLTNYLGYATYGMDELRLNHMLKLMALIGTNVNADNNSDY